MRGERRGGYRPGCWVFGGVVVKDVSVVGGGCGGGRGSVRGGGKVVGTGSLEVGAAMLGGRVGSVSRARRGVRRNGCFEGHISD
jgi:hypothetical protein